MVQGGVNLYYRVLLVNPFFQFTFFSAQNLLFELCEVSPEVKMQGLLEEHDKIKAFPFQYPAPYQNYGESEVFP